MKKAYLTILLLLSSIHLFAQDIEWEYYDKIQQTTEFLIPQNIIELNDQYIVLSKYKERIPENNTFKLHHTLTALSLDGQVIKEEKIQPSENEFIPKYFFINDIIQATDDTFYVFGVIQNEESDNHNLYIACYDRDLNMLWKKELFKPYLSFHRAVLKRNYNGNILLFGGVYTVASTSTDPPNIAFIMELNNDLEIIHSSFFKRPFTESSPEYYINNILKKPNTSHYLLTGVIYSITHQQNFYIAEVDSAFNIISPTYLEYIDCVTTFTPSNNMISISDSTWLLSGNSTFYIDDNGIETILDNHIGDRYGIIKYNYSGKAFKKVTFGDPSSPRIDFYLGFKNNMIKDIKNNNFIYLSAYCFPFYDNKGGMLWIAKIDKNLNTIWEKTYRENDAEQYYNFQTIQSKDGNHLILLNRFKNPISQENGLYIIKLNINNNDGISENNQNPLGITLYPNPATDIIRIKTSDKEFEGVLEILNISGQVVLRQPVKQASSISVCNLEKGIYIYTIKRNNTVLKSGKWVKE